jgi:Na+/proline symporter
MQAQRILSAKNVPTLKNILLANGLLRFPITLSYCLGGLIVGTFALQNQEFMNLIPVGKTDLMIPIFIEHYLPNGVIGVLVVAIIAAAMSAYSSILNSLSAVSMEEIISKRTHFDETKYVLYSKLTTVAWGIATLVFSLYVGSIAKTVIEAINKIGSVFYGPMLATFLVAILVPRVNGKAMNIGLLVGVAVNMFLWIFVPQVFWFWWNFIGCSMSFTVAFACSYFIDNPVQNTAIEIDKKTEPMLTIYNLILIAFFVVIIMVSLNLAKFF